MERNLLDTIHIYAFLYDPNLPNTKDAIVCFYNAIAMIYSTTGNKTFYNFIKENPAEKYNDSRNSLFHWSYQLRKYVLGDIKDYNTFYKEYESIKIDKTTWAHPTWNSIHCLAIISDKAKNKYISKTYKSLISCLQFIIPCEMCRNHLVVNLKNDHIDSYLNGNLFLWSFNLHNIVNKSIDKPKAVYKEMLIQYMIKID